MLGIKAPRRAMIHSSREKPNIKAVAEVLAMIAMRILI
jgi:hypothetical protein